MSTGLQIRRPARPAPRSGALELVRAETPDEVERLAAGWPDAAGRLPSSQFGWIRACLAAFDSDAAQARRGHRHRPPAGGRGSLGRPATPRRMANGASRRRRVGRTGRPGMGRPGRSQPAGWRPRGWRYPVHLPRVPADSPVIEALRRAARGRALCLVRPAAPHPFIALDDSWIEPSQHLLAVDRRRLWHARRAAERRGPLATEIHAPDLDQLPQLLDRTLELDRAMQAAGPRPPDASRTLDQTVFYRHYAEAACVDGTLRVCFLRAGSRLAAAWLAVESEGSLWLLKAAADPGLAACWPEQLLAHDAIRYAAEANLESVECWGRRKIGCNAGPPPSGHA